MKTAVRAIGPVGGVVPFPGLNLDDTGPDDRGNPMGRETFIRRQTGRNAEDGNNLAAPSARTANASNTEESTPPENATPSGAVPMSREPTAWAAAESSPVRG